MTFPDAGPNPDGSRNAIQWARAIGEDMSLIRRYLRRLADADDDEKLKLLAGALKEAHRLEKDIYRYADEVHGIKRHKLKGVQL